MFKIIKKRKNHNIKEQDRIKMITQIAEQKKIEILEIKSQLLRLSLAEETKQQIRYS